MLDFNICVIYFGCEVRLGKPYSIPWEDHTKSSSCDVVVGCIRAVYGRHYVLATWTQEPVIGYLLIIPYQLIKFQAPSSNTFRDILLTRFHPDFFSKGQNSRKGDNSDKKKKYGLVIFFHEEPIHEISKP